MAVGHSRPYNGGLYGLRMSPTTRRLVSCPCSRPSAWFPSPLGPLVTLGVLLDVAALSVLRQRPLEDVGDSWATLMSVDRADAARLSFDQPQPKLPPLHALDLRPKV
jgi:hypothetical protein